ncbi:MAG: flagellar export protein FliJ [Desulfopila sp.]
MKPFTLDSVLDYRRQLEEKAQGHLVAAQQAREQVELQLAEQRAMYRSLAATIDRQQLAGVNILELIDHEEHLQYLKNQIDMLAGELQKKSEHLARTRRELLTRSKERRTMDKLKERQTAEWQNFLQKKEAATLDEIAILYHDK